MYGSKLGDINSLRYEKFIERFSAKPGEVLTSYNGVDMSLLPPLTRESENACEKSKLSSAHMEES